MTNQEVDRLLKNIAQGDIDSLEKLYNEMKRPIYYYALHISQDPDIAEDVMQDTFVSLIQNCKSFVEKGGGRAWLLTIAKNKTLDVLKKKRSCALDDCQTEEVRCCMDDGIESQESVQSLLSILKEKERNIVTLRVFVGLTLTQISKDLNMPTGSVFWLYNNAMKKLKKSIERGNEDVSES